MATRWFLVSLTLGSGGTGLAPQLSSSPACQETRRCDRAKCFRSTRNGRAGTRGAVARVGGPESHPAAPKGQSAARRQASAARSLLEALARNVGAWLADDLGVLVGRLPSWAVTVKCGLGALGRAGGPPLPGRPQGLRPRARAGKTPVSRGPLVWGAPHHVLAHKLRRDPGWKPWWEVA